MTKQRPYRFQIKTTQSKVIGIDYLRVSTLRTTRELGWTIAVRGKAVKEMGEGRPLNMWGEKWQVSPQAKYDVHGTIWLFGLGSCVGRHRQTYRHNININITGPAATQITGRHSILFILYTTARLHCVCLLRFTMLYFIAWCSFSVIFSHRATMLINPNLNLKQQ